MDELSEDNTLNVGEFYELVTAHLEAAFGRRRPRWIRGEVAKTYEKSHLYLDLVDAATGSDARRPVLNAHCWASAWGPLKRRLAASGVTLAPGAVINVYGYVDVYAPQGKLGFSIMDLDVAGLQGDVARRRQELISRLREEGLLTANKERLLSPVPLRVGLIASPGTEGFQDFTGQLLRSNFAFEVRVVTTQVQGDAAPAQIVAALERLDTVECDVICLVRGGGSKGDLACFDDERIARAIAACATPVMTGIGHTGDETVADLVAHTFAITPTKLGEDLVQRVAQWRDRYVRIPAETIRRLSSDLVTESLEFVGERRRTVVFAVRDRIRGELRHVLTLRHGLWRASRQVLESSRTWLVGSRQLVAAYDPQRRFAQGWAVVMSSNGSVVKSVRDVSRGEEVSIRIADGVIHSVVSEKEGT